MVRNQEHFFLCKASKFSPDHVDCRIDKFLQWFLEEKLKSLSEEEFQVGDGPENYVNFTVGLGMGFHVLIHS